MRRSLRPALLVAMLGAFLLGTPGGATTRGRFEAARVHESVLHAFTCCTDGEYAYSPMLIGSDGALYGTTEAGGSQTGCSGPGCGVVFKLTPNGKQYRETFLYRFLGGEDAEFPSSGLIADQSGDLFGTTYGGGGGISECRCGTVYELQPAGRGYKESLIYSFQGSPDGASPAANLVADSAGNLYGTTTAGGIGNCSAEGCGTVFKLTRTGSSFTKSTIYSFAGGTSDGGTPLSALIVDAQGALYGTTSQGGPFGIGTVFRLVPKGSGYRETVLYSFGSQAGDGSLPQAGLVADNAGDLYGTASRGGTNGVGVIFRLKPAGRGFRESVLYSFGLPPDAHTPYASLTFDSTGGLYGTTTQGGSHALGAVFKLSPAGDRYHESVVYSFTDGKPDGATPYANLVSDATGALYGTTTACSTTLCGGTVFRLEPR